MPSFFPEHCPHCWCVRGILQVCQHRRYHEGEKCVVIFISAHIALMRQHRACMTHFFPFCCKKYSTVEKKKPNTPPLRIHKLTFLFLPYFLCVIGFILYNFISCCRSTLRQNCRLSSGVKRGTEDVRLCTVFYCVCLFKRGFSKQIKNNFSSLSIMHSWLKLQCVMDSVVEQFSAAKFQRQQFFVYTWLQYYNKSVAEPGNRVS